MLPTSNRLRSNRDFRKIYARGRSYPNPICVLYVLPREPEESSGLRIGFVTSKKLGGAVARNRIKRRLREAVRLMLPKLTSLPYDLIFVGRSRAKAADWEEICGAILELSRRAKLLLEKEQTDGDRAETE